MCVCVCVCVFIPKSSQGLLVLDVSYLGKLCEECQKKIKCINNDDNRSSGNKSYSLLKVSHGHLILSYLISATLTAMPITAWNKKAGKREEWKWSFILSRVAVANNMHHNILVFILYLDEISYPKLFYENWSVMLAD